MFDFRSVSTALPKTNEVAKMKNRQHSFHWKTD